MLGVWKNRGFMKDIILLNQNAYSKEDYHEIRKHNREVFKLNQEDYCRKQLNFEILYEVSLGGKVFYLNRFFDGLSEIRNRYNIDVPSFMTYDDVFSLRSFRLPNNIDYFIKYGYYGFKYEMSYIDHENMFTCELPFFCDEAFFTIYSGIQSDAEEIFFKYFK